MPVELSALVMTGTVGPGLLTVTVIVAEEALPEVSTALAMIVWLLLEREAVLRLKVQEAVPEARLSAAPSIDTPTLDTATLSEAVQEK